MTPKVGVDPGGVNVLRRLPLLSLGIAALVACLAARVLATVGWTDLPSMPAFALAATLVIGAFEATVILTVLRALAGHRQRRSEYRVAVEVPARIGGDVAEVVDLTPGGAGVLVDSALPAGGALTLEISLPGLDGEPVAMETRCRVRSCRRLDDGEYLLGLQFTRVSDEALRRLTEYCRVTLPTQRLGRLPQREHGDGPKPRRRRSDAVLAEEVMPA